MYSQLGHSEPLETSLTHEGLATYDDEVVREYVNWMDSFGMNKRKYFESLRANLSHLTPSIEKSPTLEEKPLPTHLRYAYLGEASTLSVIISSSLSHTKEERLLIGDYVIVFLWICNQRCNLPNRASIRLSSNKVYLSTNIDQQGKP